ncbi:hypothetical protein LIER_05996 [Lithospermum erythrorhizon]|uniref:Uncharacterized protein n=1 Tax=Lithospermum erythrorhizon TaxID=34254 RepID=A0AAV3P7A7_LITER
MFLSVENGGKRVSYFGVLLSFPNPTPLFGVGLLLGKRKRKEKGCGSPLFGVGLGRGKVFITSVFGITEAIGKTHLCVFYVDYVG